MILAMRDRLSKKTLRVAGLMSGTSADGVDVAIVDIGPRGVRLVAFDMFEYPPALRRRVLALCDVRTARVDEICHMNALLGEVFAAAVIELCARSGVEIETIDLIGSHGQTIWHDPVGRREKVTAEDAEKKQKKQLLFSDSSVSSVALIVRSTLQIAEPSVIAERTGITVVADFRPRDVAAGGQGAPLVPYADLVLFGHPTRARALQNIGGIANVTYLPALEDEVSQDGTSRHQSPRKAFRGRSASGGSLRGRSASGRSARGRDSSGCSENARFERALEGIVAFDTGPGNMIMDRVTHHATRGRMTFDRGGVLAAKGTVNAPLLRELMRHPYLKRKPPKTTGREMFGQAFSDQLYKRATSELHLPPQDILATVTAFTAASIADAYRRFLPGVEEVILCGGGARNGTLVGMLARELPQARVRPMDELGISADAKEAISFAILAEATVRGRRANVPSATGASRRVVLGKIVPCDMNINRI